MKRFTAITAILLFAGISLNAQNYFYSVFSGDTIVLSISVTGGNVQWVSTNDTIAGPWMPIPGAVGNNYQYIVPPGAGNKYIRAEITDPLVCSVPFYGNILKLRVVTGGSQILVGDYFSGGIVFYKDAGGGGMVVSEQDILISE